MNTFSPIQNFNTIINQNIFKPSLQYGNLWKDYIVRVIQNISQHMHQNSNIAIAIILTVNGLTFINTYFIANYLDQRLEKNKNLNNNQRIFKNILLNEIMMGSFILASNLFITKMTHYPLSRFFLTGITLISITARVILNKLYQEFNKEKKAVELLKKQQIKDKELDLLVLVENQTVDEESEINPTDKKAKSLEFNDVIIESDEETSESDLEKSQEIEVNDQPKNIIIGNEIHPVDFESQEGVLKTTPLHTQETSTENPIDPTSLTPSVNLNFSQTQLTFPTSPLSNPIGFLKLKEFDIDLLVTE